MPKKQTKEDEQKKVQVKVIFSAEQHRDVRLAAAERGMTLSDFIVASVMPCTEKCIADIAQRQMAKTKRRPNSSDA
jgi:uncharacterized protein (DUF1778 family)